MLIDTHTHLFLKDFDDDIDDVILVCKKQNIHEFYLPNIDSSTIVPLKTLADKYPENCFPMMGLHPCYVKENYEDEIAAIKEEFETGNYIGIGEIGVDLYWDKTFKKEQIEIFQQQLDWAAKSKKPVTIHSRDALDITISCVENQFSEDLTGVFHCFNGTVEDAARIAKLEGFFMGIGGVVTYKNAGVDLVVKEIPLDKLVLETDSPYLPPTPYRGKRNDSSYLIHIAQKIAELKDVGLDKVAQKTTENARSIFIK